MFLTRRFLKFFLLVAIATKILHGMAFLNNFEREPRFIAVQFGGNQPSSSGGDAI